MRRHPMLSRRLAPLARTSLVASDADDRSEDMCMLPNSDDILDDAGENARKTLPFDTALAITPLLVPLGAGILWDDVAHATRMVTESINQAWIPVDGGAYQIAILTPTINGILVPSISFVLGTLCATTIGQLRQRQVELRECINLESCELNVLRAQLVEARIEEDLRARLLRYVHGYVTRVISESRADTSIRTVERAGVADNELVGLLGALYEATEGHKLPQHILDAQSASVRALNGYRSRRLAALASTFPTVHWVVLVLCATSIVLLFLIESDQEVLRFLDSVQLRVLFTCLVGCFAGIASVILDLINPFRGMSRADGATFQLFSIRASLAYEMCCTTVPEPPNAADQSASRASSTG